jgi:hypothetical protein
MHVGRGGRFFALFDLFFERREKKFFVAIGVGFVRSLDELTDISCTLLDHHIDDHVVTAELGQFADGCLPDFHTDQTVMESIMMVVSLVEWGVRIDFLDVLGDHLESVARQEVKKHLGSYVRIDL